jgi:apolipoprotein N-acyltransferase
MTGSQLGTSLQPRAPLTREPMSTSWRWLAVAAVLLPFANGRNTIAIVAWLAPVFVLRFLRGGGAWRFVIAWPILSAAWAFQFRGMVPAPQPIITVVWAAYGLFQLLPFIPDRLLVRRLPGFTSTLAFPCAAMGFDYLLSLLPYGSWGSPAYTQYGNLALMQLASIAGIYGITFLIAWSAAVVNWAWERGFEPRTVRRGVLVYAFVLSAVFVVGSVRLMAAPSGPTVRVASLTAQMRQFPNDDLARRSFTGKLTSDEIVRIREWSRALDDDLLRRAGREADAGAKVVFWGEANSWVLPADEAWLFSRASELAREKRIYLGVANALWHYGEPRPLENTFILFAPDGRQVWRFLKAHPVPGGEATISRPSDGRLPFFSAPFGRLSCVICFDADSVQLLQQAGRGQADILLDPSNDWRAIDPWHTQMAIFRAVEQGLNMVRHTSNGLSIAVDYQGRVRGAMDHYEVNGDRALVAELPVRGVRTIYARVGDVFSWLALAVLAALASVAIIRPRGAGR